MRVLFVSHYALPHLGGIEVVIDQLARELVRRGHGVTHLASAALRPGEGPDAGDRPYRLVTVPAANAPELRLGVPFPVFGPALARAARREVGRADVVHAHGFLYMSTIAAFAAARAARGRPARVLTEHVGHVAYDHRAVDAAEAAAIATVGRLSARMADALVAYNDRVRGELARLAPGRPVEHIANGIDTDRFRPPDPGERERLRRARGWDERPRALFVGRLVAKKGFDAAVAACAAAGAELVAAGPGGLDRSAPHVELLGALPHGEMPELYRSVDALLLPSHGEGFPVAVQEAAASGLPMVLADDPVYRSAAAAAGRGMVLARTDPEALADALRELLQDAEAARADAAEAARLTLSWAASADTHERLYERVLEGRRARPGGPG